ncbi:MAG: hypothetical protein WBW94_05185 [Anaerolineales bacterium]
MWLLPYENLLIKTNLSQDAITQKLQDVTDTSGKIVWFPTFSRKHKLYRGKLTKEGFNIYRWINNQDSFLPFIDGKFLSQNMGGKIRVRMHLHWVVTIFMTLWLGFFGLILANEFLYMLTNIIQSGNLPANWIEALSGPSIFFLFGYGMMIIVFKIDSKREKQFIQTITEAYEITELGIFEKDELPI